MSNQNQPTKTQRNYLTIGFARNVKTAKSEFHGLSFIGGKETDEVEIIARRKSDGAEMPLYWASTNKDERPNIVMLPNTYKTDSKEDMKKPDFFIKIEV